MSITVTVETKYSNHIRGLEALTIRGDAPVVAEILRVVAGGDHPAHPESAKADVGRIGVGPRSVSLRAYPIGEWKGERISRRSLYRAVERLAEAFGAIVTDEEDA